MKRFTLLFVAALTLSCTAFSQIKFGAKAGLNMAKWKVEDNSNFKFKPGIEAGIFAELPVVGSFSVQPELLFSMNGARIKSSTQDGKFTMNYISVPVLGKYTFHNGLAVFAGPRVDFLMKGEQEFEGTKLNLKDEVNKTDIAGVAGLEYNFAGGVFISARYSRGFKNVDKDVDYKIKNYSFGVSVGFKF